MRQHSRRGACSVTVRFVNTVGTVVSTPVTLGPRPGTSGWATCTALEVPSCGLKVHLAFPPNPCTKLVSTEQVNSNGVATLLTPGLSAPPNPWSTRR